MDTDTNDTTRRNEAAEAPETLSPAQAAEAMIVMLSPREREVATLIARGESNHEIAKALGISIKTYDTHRLHILEKLHVRNVVQLSKLFIRAGIVSA